MVHVRLIVILNGFQSADVIIIIIWVIYFADAMEITLYTSKYL